MADQNVWKLYFIYFFHHLIFAYVIERLFWEQRGMSIPLVVYTEIIYAITLVLFEVPTGVLSDRWGRKNMLICSAALGFMELLILIFSTQFWHFALAIFLAGLGQAAMSGSGNALLYDSLKTAGKEQDFLKYLGRLHAIELSALIVAALSGSLMANMWGLTFNYWLSLISIGIAWCITLSLVEPRKSLKKQTPTTSQSKQKNSFTVAILFFRHHPHLYPILLAGMVLGASFNFIDEFWQLYLDRLDFSVVFFGVFSASWMLLQLPGSLWVATLEKRFGQPTLIGITILVFVLGFSYLSLVNESSALGAMLLLAIFAGWIEPLTTGALHRHITDSSQRATIDSFQSLGFHLVLIVTGLGFGWISTQWDIFGGYGWIALLCLVFFVYYSYHVFKKEP